MGDRRTRRARVSKVVLGATAAVLMTIGATAPTGCQATPPADQWHAVASASAVGGVAFGDRDHAWRVGAGGLILASADGGATWVRQTSPASEDLVAVDALDATHVAIAGRNGSVLTTSDGGATWVQRLVGVGELRDVEFADPFHGWVSTAYYGLWKTADGGLTWSNEPMAGRIGAIDFSDGSHGVAVGAAPSLFVRTDAGGRPWKAPADYGYPSMLFQAVSFLDHDHGWAAGTQGAIARTSDGGSTWTFAPSGIQEDFTGVAFNDTMHGIAVGVGQYEDQRLLSRLYATSDGGATWAPMADAPTGNLAGIAHRPGGGYLVAGRGRSIFASTDGQRWTQTDRADPQASVMLHQMAAPTADDLLVAGNQGTVLASHDAGTTWTQQPKLTGGDLHAIAAVGSSAWTGGFQVDPQDVYGFDLPLLFRSGNGGATWREQPTTGLPVPGRIEQLRFDDAQRGWLVGSSDGNNGLFLARTDDGGATWTIVLRPPGGPGLSFDIVGDHVWVAGGGQLFHSSDRGATWPTPASAPVSAATEALWSVDFVDATHGWIGAGSTVFRTVDGGASWAPFTVYRAGRQTTTRVQQVRFVDRLHGYGLGDGMFETFDGGVTWRSEAAPQPTGFSYPASDQFSLTPGGRPWLVGDQSLLVTGPVRLRSAVTVAVGARVGSNGRSITVTVRPADGFTGTPSGQVAFESGGATATTVTLDATGKATATIPAGPFIARYLGDATFGARPSVGIGVPA